MFSNNSSAVCADNSTCSSMPSGGTIMVAYSSETERILSLVIIILILIMSLLGQASVIITVSKTESLHSPHFTIIWCYCVGDLLVISTQSIMYVWSLIANTLPLTFCRVLSVISHSTAFGMVGHIGYMALERYSYFCHPMKHGLMFKKGSMAATMAFIYGVSCAYCIVTEISLGRYYHATVMACNLPESRFHTILQIVLFILPTILITVFCSFKIWRLSIQNSVAPAVPQQAFPPGQERVPRKQQASRAVRVILLVSGVFWGTSLPVSIARSIYFSSGITWQDLDSRHSFTQSVTLRIIYYLYALVSPLVNPWIYYYSRKDLRLALRKVLGINTNSIAPQNQDQ